MPVRTTRPITDAEVIRWLDERIRRLEQRYTATIGIPPNAYLISVNGVGQLIATNTTTSTVTVLANP